MLEKIHLIGSNGFITYEKKGTKFNSQSFPALSVNPLDVTGAGDTVTSGGAGLEDVILSALSVMVTLNKAVSPSATAPINS